MTPEQATKTARILSRRGTQAYNDYVAWTDKAGEYKEQIAKGREIAWAKAPEGSSKYREHWVEAQVADLVGALLVAEGRMRGLLTRMRHIDNDKTTFQSILAQQRAETTTLGAAQDWNLDVGDETVRSDAPVMRVTEDEAAEYELDI